MSKLRILLASMGIGLCAGCTGKSATGVCVDGGPAFSITVLDSTSHAPLLSAVIQAVGQTVSVPAGGAYPIAIGMHAGLYPVVIRNTGYTDWSRTLNVASFDALGCQPITVVIVALMQPTK